MLLRTVPELPYNLYKPIEGSLFAFMPLQVPDQDATTTSTDQSLARNLVELVVLPESKDCPVRALRSPEDTYFHTGDLFEEVEPGFYEVRERADDWIKLQNGGRCDTW